MELGSLNNQTKQSSRAKATGSPWNTLVCAAKGKELWDLGWKWVPDILSLFELLKKVIATVEEFKVLDAIYEAMPRRPSPHTDSSVHRSGLRCWKCGMFSEVTGENPERILSSLDNFGKRRAAAQAPLPFLYVG